MLLLLGLPTQKFACEIIFYVNNRLSISDLVKEVSNRYHRRWAVIVAFRRIVARSRRWIGAKIHCSQIVVNVHHMIHMLPEIVARDCMNMYRGEEDLVENAAVATKFFWMTLVVIDSKP